MGQVLDSYDRHVAAGTVRSDAAQQAVAGRLDALANVLAAQPKPGGLFGFMKKLPRWACRSPDQGARTSGHVARAPELAEVSGGYFARCKPARPSRAAQDRGAALRLWEISEQLTATTASPA